MNVQRFRNSTDKVTSVAVALHRNLPHVGIAIRDSGGIKLLHFAWHRETRFEAPKSDKYVACEPELKSEELSWLAAQVRQFGKKLPNVPYALRLSKRVTMGANGDVELESANCSTFVIIVFEIAKLPLIADDTWQERESDGPRQQELVEALRGDPENVPADHDERVAREVGCIRYRPEEVAGAALVDVDRWPVKFPAAEQAGLWMLEQRHPAPDT